MGTLRVIDKTMNWQEVEVDDNILELTNIIHEFLKSSVYKPMPILFTGSNSLIIGVVGCNSDGELYKIARIIVEK